MRVPGFTALRAAVHALGGTPRLYRAARRGGAGVLDALGLLVTSALVLFAIAPRAAGVPGRQNAVRHFVWQALLTARHGEGVARSVAEAQERDSVQPRDSAIDLRNNAVGQRYGASHATELAGMSLLAAAREALRAGLAAWEADELFVTPGREGRSAGRRRRGSRGPATPPGRS